jgi:predicted ATPase
LSRARRLPNVDTLFVREERQQPHRQTWQEQYALMQQWEAALNRRREMKGA